MFRVEKLSGKISHAKADGSLAKGIEIHAYKLLKKLNNTKFYDSMPPLPYIMAILWVTIFPSLVHDKKRKMLHTCKKIAIDVEVDRVHRLVSKFAPPSNPQCIKRSWIVKSLNEFVRIGLAQNLTKVQDPLRGGQTAAAKVARRTGSKGAHAQPDDFRRGRHERQFAGCLYVSSCVVAVHKKSGLVKVVNA